MKKLLLVLKGHDFDFYDVLKKILPQSKLITKVVILKLCAFLTCHTVSLLVNETRLPPMTETSRKHAEKTHFKEGFQSWTRFVIHFKAEKDKNQKEYLRDPYDANEHTCIVGGREDDRICLLVRIWSEGTHPMSRL